MMSRLQATISVTFCAFAWSTAVDAQNASATATRGTVLDTPAADVQSSAATNYPRRGMTMAHVTDRYGQPRERHGPVGEPPITRWEYAGFSVYFEHNKVLHSVVPGDPPVLHHRDELVSGG